MSLLVSELSVTKSGKPIVTGAGFTAPGCQVAGLIGPNGAGKSTLLSALIGLTPASGSVSFKQHNLLALHRRARARLVAFVEQSAATEERLSVHDVVALGRIPFEPAWQATPDAMEQEIIDNALAEVGMSNFASRRFSTLSGGEQQRVHVARSLAQQPQLLLLDEPTSHLDIRAQLELLTLLRNKARQGLTVVLAIHDINLAARFCDHLVVMIGGRVVTEGTPTEVVTPELLLDVYGVAARLVPDVQGQHPVIVFE